MTPDYSFGQKGKTFDDFADLSKAPRTQGNITQKAASIPQAVDDSFESRIDYWNKDLEQFKKDHTHIDNFNAQWQGSDSGFDYYRQRARDMANNPNQFEWQPFSNMQRAEAAELTPEQQAQMAAMEAGNFYPTEPAETPDLSAVTEQLYADIEAMQEGISELMTGLGESITQSLTTAFEGANEMFTGFGEQITTALTSAQEGATSALEAIQNSFTTTKEMIQTSWAELPGFFSNVFSGLGAAAEAAGSAIHAGLTAPIGSIIGEWQAAAAQISSIISSISASGSSVGSTVSAVIAGVRGHAEGGFITQPELALIGEKGAELILPLNDRERSMELLSQSGLLENNLSSGSSSSGNNVEVNVTFNLQGTFDEAASQAEEKMRELADKVAAVFSTTLADAHHNRTLI